MGYGCAGADVCHMRVVSRLVHVQQRGHHGLDHRALLGFTHPPSALSFPRRPPSCSMRVLDSEPSRAPDPTRMSPPGRLSSGGAPADAPFLDPRTQTPAPPEDDALPPLLEDPWDLGDDSDDTMPPLLDEHNVPAPPPPSRQLGELRCPRLGHTADVHAWNGWRGTALMGGVTGVIFR